MLELLKKPYEISLWDDVLTFVSENGQHYEGFIPVGAEKIVGQYYKEKKVAIIGSDVMTSPTRAFNGKITTNINGTSTFTFQIFYEYFDEEKGQLQKNPIIPLLVNERKIKVRYGAIDNLNTKWYDFIIKDVQESSSAKIFTYTARDLFINELSKTGFNLEFNNELGNNMGNVNYLAKQILAGSDWQLKGPEINLKQMREEPLYEIVLNQSIFAKNLTLVDGEGKTQILEIKKGKSIYVFYSVINNQETYFQFIYADSYQQDSENIITNKDCNYYIDVTYDGEMIKYEGQDLYEFETDDPENPGQKKKNNVISKKFRGKRYVRKSKKKFDNIIDKYVDVYDYNGKEVYGYKETQYISPNYITSYITNNSNFSSTSGWLGGVYQNSNSNLPEVEVCTVPNAKDVVLNQETNCPSFLHFQFSDSSQFLFNSGFSDYSHSIKQVAKGDKYVFRVKYGISGGLGQYSKKTSSVVSTIEPLTIKVATYTTFDKENSKNNGKYNILKTLFETVVNYTENNLPIIEDSKNYIEKRCEALESFSYDDLKKQKVGFFFNFGKNNTDYYIKEVQFFPYVPNPEGIPYLPGSTEVISGPQDKYYYYYPDSGYKTIEEINFIHSSLKPWEDPGLTLQYNTDTFEKIRSITASQSNRFNLLQNLCELFECWIHFEIIHNKDGSIKIIKEEIETMDKDETGKAIKQEIYRQQKNIYFKEYIEKNNFVGFKYGTNLKSITRKIESEGITSKIIVKNNSNHFGKNGFCSIARADENYSGENFIYDFNYFIQKGLLDFNAVNNDLYIDSEAQHYLGYYKKLKNFNKERDKLITINSGLSADIPQYEASYQSSSNLLQSAIDELNNVQLQLQRRTSLTYEYLMTDKDNTWWEDEDTIKDIASITRLNSIISINKKSNLDNFNKLEKAKREQIECKEKLKKLIVQKNKLNQQFYSKYSRFIQEGSWIKEEYVDDNLYYLDAEETLHAASQPKVSYTINVLEISQIYGYENYIFNLGDKTFIEDKEFFGYNLSHTAPYQEEIIITEITNNLDNPEQNVIKVQNYKTQFEDLFQRITATSQAIEYSKGHYNKATSIVKEDGTIEIDILQNSVVNNSLKLENAKDQSVVWDETGITATNLSAPSEILRLYSGGIMLSTDGGSHWTTGIDAKGINANTIVTGQINTKKVQIMSGSNASFIWNSLGLNAFKFLPDSNGNPSFFDNHKFVRFDQYGIYGIDSDKEFNPNISDEDGIIGTDKIRKYANFSLTWEGFQMKTVHENGGYIQITPEEDFQIVRKGLDKKGQEIEREIIKIGQIKDELIEGKPTFTYGIRISDTEGNSVMRTGSDGNLWLQNALYIGKDESKTTVQLGYLGKTKEDLIEGEKQKTNIHEVINSNDKFIVYEDGSMKATEGEFTGKITATGGTIGGMKIDQVISGIESIDSSRALRIKAEKGTIFKVTKDTIPGSLSFVVDSNSFAEFSGTIEWEGSKDFLAWTKLTNQEGISIDTATNRLEMQYSFFKKESINDTYYIRINCHYNGKDYTDFVTLNSISDGAPGSTGQPGEPGPAGSIIVCRIDSSNGYVINTTSQIKNTKLTAKVFKDGADLDPEGTKLIYQWFCRKDNGVEFELADHRKTIDFNLDFDLSSQIYFTAEEKA